VKDAVEALGVPHTEVDLILLNGVSVGFDQALHDSDRVAVYPVFESVDVAGLTRLRPEPLRVVRFVADVHLGTLARYLRLLGFDTLWRNDLDDDEIIDLSLAEKRIILTRDRGILRTARVSHGYWLRATQPLLQLEGVVRQLDLERLIAPYTRCMQCNGRLEPVSRDTAVPNVPRRIAERFSEFMRCVDCRRIYWPGTHRLGLDALVARASRR
jgi:uncharacterized protein with PIN domain